MFYRLKNSLQRGLFDWRVRSLMHTAPVAIDPHGLSVLTQLQHKDLLMYLAAIKSFARQVPVAQVYVLDDGSLQDSDRVVVSEHVPGIQFLELPDFQVDGLPRGGCWERLVAIANLSKERYMVQLDADTLTLGAAQEVVDAWRNNQSFTIGTWDGQTIEYARDRAVDARKVLIDTSPHVQVVAEAHFDELTNLDRLRYVRGCAGFAGFSTSSDKLQFMYTVSAQMEQLIKSKWLEWGSEQVMSNLVVANQSNASVLPHPIYADCMKMRPLQTRFVHFIGQCRFQHGRYAHMVTQALLS